MPPRGSGVLTSCRVVRCCADGVITVAHNFNLISCPLRKTKTTVVKCDEMNGLDRGNRQSGGIINH